eukprot:TRINITY_DN4308_c0_g1_i4.p1 TRINITY_DN4308_c0_g1~~TRINITY_DN4308_c0_g1_i4.p1  ORF type:complete len:313 (+),score=56.65 TRINITY_DN4308_c0_g1_i4:1054-1992(+)
MYPSEPYLPRSLEQLFEGDSPLKLSMISLADVSHNTRIVQQLISAVSHLHSCSLVHTRLSPQSVRLHSNQQLQVCSLHAALRTDQHHVLPSYDTAPWACPPETLSGTPTPAHKSLDVFAVGCLVYYILTHGAHPFGKRSVRAQRSARDDPALPGLLAKAPLAVDLVRRAVKHSAGDRAVVEELSEHPALWSVARSSQFLCDLSDRLDSEPQGSPLRVAVEAVSLRVVGKDWSKRLDEWMKQDLFARRGYRTSSLQDLLRAVRNKTRHCLVLPAEAAGVIQPNAESVTAYFLGKFPKMLLETVQASNTNKGEE